MGLVKRRTAGVRVGIWRALSLRTTTTSAGTELPDRSTVGTATTQSSSYSDSATPDRRRDTTGVSSPLTPHSTGVDGASPVAELGGGGAWSLVVMPRWVAPVQAKAGIRTDVESDALIRWRLRCVFSDVLPVDTVIYRRRGSRQWVIESGTRAGCRRTWMGAPLYAVQKVVQQAWLENPKGDRAELLVDPEEWLTDEEAALVSSPVSHVPFAVLMRLFQEERRLGSFALRP